MTHGKRDRERGRETKQKAKFPFHIHTIVAVNPDWPIVLLFIPPHTVVYSTRIYHHWLTFRACICSRSIHFTQLNSNEINQPIRSKYADWVFPAFRRQSQIERHIKRMLNRAVGWARKDDICIIAPCSALVTRIEWGGRAMSEWGWKEQKENTTSCTSPVCWSWGPFIIFSANLKHPHIYSWGMARYHALGYWVTQFASIINKQPPRVPYNQSHPWRALSLFPSCAIKY